MSWPWAVCLSLLVATHAAAEVSGRVRVRGTLEPVAGARVSLQATDVETVTSAQGEFILDALGPDLVIVAAHKGFYNGGLTTTTTAGPTQVEILLDRVSLEPDPDYELRAPWACAMMCHAEQLDQWMLSPMAKAGVNTWVYDLYDGTGTQGGLGGFVYRRDSEKADAAPASHCASCHQPALWLTDPGTALEPISQNPSDAVLHGVSCDLCHKVANVDETRLNTPGFYGDVVTLARPGGGAEVQFGLLGDASFQRPSQMMPAYNPELGSELCAACHQDKNDPDLDGEFEESNGVVSEPTYFEWKSSSYGDPSSPKFRTCANCHMLPTGAPEACSVLGGTLTRPVLDVRAHDISGTTPYFLEHAVTLALTATAGTGRVDVEVRLTNDQAGHSVPTGMSIRNMILLVSVRSGSREYESTEGPVVDDLGGVGSPLEGNFAGRPGKLFGRVMADASGNGPVFFTDATSILWDNRIPALETDVTRYVFAVPDGGAVQVEARLIYRRAWRALTAAKGWTVTGFGEPLEDAIAPTFGHVMEEGSMQLSVPSLPDAGIADADPPESGASDAGAVDGARDEPPDERGCGCRGGHEPTPPLTLLVLLLAIRARSRRH
ncbi:MAG: hypothetical protein HY791_32415 [Deltaproteobacteria bacterium]|nr:hypothetical protein [Deltaproteobacteria bacterium]